MEIGLIIFGVIAILVSLVGLGIGAFVLLGSLHQSVNTPDAFKSARQELCAQLVLKPQGDYSHVAGKRGKLQRSIRWVQEGGQWQTLIHATTAGLSAPQVELTDASQIPALGLGPKAQQALTLLLEQGGQVTLGDQGVELRLQGEKLAQGFLQKRLLAAEELALALAS